MESRKAELNLDWQNSLIKNEIACERVNLEIENLLMINEQGDKNKIGEALTKVRQSLSNGIISPKFQDWMQPI